MSSKNKTAHIGLSKWQGSDIPQMSDFLFDNIRIDNAVGEHTENLNIHITGEERNKWNSMCVTGTYMGDGASSRVIDFKAGFQISWGLVFAVGTFPCVDDYDNKMGYNYFAVFSNKGSTSGVSLNDNKLSVVQSSLPVSGSGLRKFNESGVNYVYVIFR